MEKEMEYKRLDQLETGDVFLLPKPVMYAANSSWELAIVAGVDKDRTRHIYLPHSRTLQFMYIYQGNGDTYRVIDPETAALIAGLT